MPEIQKGQRGPLTPLPPRVVRRGAVIVFADGVEKSSAEEALRQLELKGIIAPGRSVEEFDPEYEGWPVWYIP